MDHLVVVKNIKFQEMHTLNDDVFVEEIPLKPLNILPSSTDDNEGQEGMQNVSKHAPEQGRKLEEKNMKSDNTKINRNRSDDDNDVVTSRHLTSDDVKLNTSSRQMPQQFNSQVSNNEDT
jgi:hypothetical protein